MDDYIELLCSRVEEHTHTGAIRGVLVIDDIKQLIRQTRVLQKNYAEALSALKAIAEADQEKLEEFVVDFGVYNKYAARKLKELKKEE